VRKLVGREAVGVLAVAVVSAGALGCGSGGDGESPPERGGDVRVSVSAFPDHLDPQLASTREARQAVRLTHLPLLAYGYGGGEEGAEVIPALAEELPEVSEDGVGYELRLRRGMVYSDGTPIRASDFERAIERLFDLGSPGAPLYAAIAGAREYGAGAAASIEGIETDDRSGRIAIELTEPRGDFPNLLALPYAAPAPRSEAAGRGDGLPPASGPYRVSAVEPPERFELDRNPRFRTVLDGGAEIPVGVPDRITVERNPDRSAQVREVRSGRADLMVDSPPLARQEEIEASIPERYRLEDTLASYHFWMNTRTPPFNDRRVRQAVNYAIDRERLARLLGGRVEPNQQILPAGMPGHEDLTLYPGPDLETATDLIAEANPVDRWVTVWTDDDPSRMRAAAYYRGVLTRIGLGGELEVIPAERYPAAIGDAGGTDLDTGLWLHRPRYPHPNEFFEPLLSGSAIAPVANRNLARADFPELNVEIERLADLGLDQAEGAYAELDRRFTEEAVWAPWGRVRVAIFVSGRIDLDRVVFHPVFGHDYSSLALLENGEK
jgi:peptide/nickel transport system substrate-binding protein